MRRVLRGLLPCPARCADQPVIAGPAKGKRPERRTHPGRADVSPRRKRQVIPALKKRWEEGRSRQQRRERADHRAQRGQHRRAERVLAAERAQQREVAARRQVRDVVLALDVLDPGRHAELRQVLYPLFEAIMAKTDA